MLRIWEIADVNLGSETERRDGILCFSPVNPGEDSASVFNYATSLCTNLLLNSFIVCPFILSSYIPQREIVDIVPSVMRAQHTASLNCIIIY